MPDRSIDPLNESCEYEWPNTSHFGVDHDPHECAEGDGCWRKGIHECWCGATVEKVAHA